MAGQSLTPTRSGSCGLPTSADHVLVDTSAALALVQRENPFHRAARARLLACRRGMSGHAAVELLSVLTRLPPPQRLSPVVALRLEETNFPESRYLSATDTQHLLRECADAGLAGGALYDGLVAAAARKHKLPLITCDRRAEATYRVLGVIYELLSAA
ncbi:type II toxin-antitoxin system VapC family toxin [Mycobacterium malmoense]|uniref:type II toxin-antitoxin system VapC family toxin n=1 Tax=Mycobacterium malmoense TaxID=1780 RepID=UPI00210C1745|nr:type II toxin-antitoxin system VapC family toxin [Mycobacterium malmoense]